MKIALKYSLFSGLLLGFSLSIGTQILTWLGYGLTNAFVWLTYVLVITCFVLTFRRVWLLQGKRINFFHGLLAVILIVLLSRYVFQLYMFLYTQYIEPEWVNKVSIYWSDLMEKGGSSQKEIEANLKSFRKSYEPSQMFTVEIIKYGFFQMVMGLVLSLYFVFKHPKKLEITNQPRL